MDLPNDRRQLRVSLLRLSTLSGVSRFRLWGAENQSIQLTPDEHARVKAALLKEHGRVLTMLHGLNLDQDSAHEQR